MTDLAHEPEPEALTPPAAPPPEPLQPQGIAAVQGQPETPQAPAEWRDLGLVHVPVADLPIPDGVSGPEDFDHHISYDAALSAAKDLPAVTADLQAGKTKDDLWREDQAAGKAYGEGRERVYDLFYGSDPVALEKVGDDYSIVSGRHRVFAVKMAGLETMPAHVQEKLA